MAKTNAERQREYRQRRAGGEQPGPKCPGCRERDSIMSRWKERTSEAIRGLERKLGNWVAERAALLAETERLTAALAEAEAGRSVPPCKACGGQLACPQCARGGGYADDF